MPIRPVSLIVVLVALAAAIYVAATGDLQTPALSNSIHMYGGPRTQSDISPDAMGAVTSLVEDSADDARVHLVVQFERLLTAAEENKLESRFHIEILEAIPVNAYVVSLPAQRALGILNELERMTPSSRGVVNIRTADKLSPALGEPGALKVPGHAVREAYGPESSLQDGVAVLLYLFSDTTAADVSHMLESLHGYSLYAEDSEAPKPPGARHGLYGPIPLIIAREHIDKLLEFDQVRWIEPVPSPAEDDLGRPLNQPQTSFAQNVIQPGAREVAGHPGAAGGGSGVLIAQWESCQPRFRQPNAHPALIDPPDLPGRIVNGNDIPARCEPSAATQDFNDPPGSHATMVAGIMVGVPPAGSYVDYYGMATEARLRSYTLEHWLTDLDSDYEDAIEAGATISQNSWGSGCEIFSNYIAPFYRWQSYLYDEAVSQRNDQGALSFENGGMLIITSAGNHGDEKLTPSLWGTARIANSAKNVLTVGNVNTQSPNLPDHWAHVSSGRGPTADGRISPVLSAPGIRLNATNSLASRGPATAAAAAPTGIISAYPDYQGPDTDKWYKDEWGTSFSAPMVSGAAALLTNVFRNTCQTEPSPASLRALLIHTAHDLVEAHSTLANVRNDGSLNQEQCSFSDAKSAFFRNQISAGQEFLVRENRAYKGPDYIYGYGLVQADRASEFAEKSHFLEDEITGGRREYRLNVNSNVLADDDGKLRVTLVWDDPPWAINSAPDPIHGLLQNDLDLELISPSGKRYFPWVLDPSTPAEPAKQNSRHYLLPVTPNLRDNRNTIEQIVISEPEPGEWKVRVNGRHMVRPPQSFTLVSSAINPPSACAGLPSHWVEHPLELPENWLFWWLFWLAVLILVLLIIALIWLILKNFQQPPNSQSPWIQIVLILSIILTVAWLIFMGYFVALAALLLFLVILFAWIS